MTPSGTAAGPPPGETTMLDGAGIGFEERYTDLGLLGQGGMGEVRRVRDRVLRRVVALKRVLPATLGPAALARFVEEVRTTAQLQHPGIVPVYDAGLTPDGGAYFTMKEVRGRELSEVIRSVHEAGPDGWETTPDGWSLRRLVGALVQVAQAVAYAHQRGVVHRDLKPANVMVGEFGEVLVMDWGLAKVRGGAEGGGDEVEGEGTRGATQVGRVIGTPAYLSPEQARGDLAGVDARSDVYGLGAMLYEVLSGRPPYDGRTRAEVVARVLSGPPVSVSEASRWASEGAGSATVADWDEAEVASPPTPATGPRGGPVPEELVAACERAMARSPADRHPTAGAFAEALQSWLDGSRRREQAAAVAATAAEKAPEAASLRARAAALRAEAAAELAGLAPWRPEDDKAGAWAKEDEATRLLERASLLELEAESLLRASLTHAPDLPEAHAALAEWYRREHAAAEASRTSSSRPEALLRQHLAALPEGHPTRRSGLAYLRGDGALTLLTDPPGAEVELFRYTLRNRRLVATPERVLGRTPLRAVPLPMGSYLCVVRHPDRPPVRYPVSLAREEHWDGAPPEGGGPREVPLPRREDLGPGDGYVPPGWFWCGGELAGVNGLPRRRLWTDGLVVRRFPVTNREYLAFLDALVADGREAEALRHAPRERASSAGELGSLIYAFDGRRFALRTDADGDAWDPEWPVMMVDWHGAAAFAAWTAARTGQAWRLPGELEWEKAARGVDGRLHPWGDVYDPSWACTNLSHRGPPLPSPVESYPVDESVYGVRGLGGNVADWCADSFVPEGPRSVGGRLSPPDLGCGAGAERIVRGGTWGSTPAGARAVVRGKYLTGYRGSFLGFRLVRSHP